MILKNLWGRKTRTLLTVSGIAVGVAAVVALGAFASGILDAYSALGGGSGADLLVMQDDALDIAFSAVDEEVGGVFEGLSGVKDVSKMVYAFAASDELPYFIVYGYELDSFAIEHFKIVEGAPLSDRAAHGGEKSLILGRGVADDLELEVGDTFRIYESTYRIAGIYETGQPFEDSAAVVTLADAQSITGKPRQVNALLLKVEPDADLARLTERIQQRFPDLVATTSSDFMDNQMTLDYISAFTWGVSFIALLIGGVGVMNTMLMSVFERTTEFGVLRALGWRPWQLLGMVLGESFMVSAGGGLVGTALGMLAVRGMMNAPALSAFMPSSFPPGLFIQGMGIALGLGLIGGSLPAWRASRLLPAEAMRAEGGTVHVPRHVRWTTLRNILRQPTRTLLTVIGIGIAMMAIVMLGAMSNGMMDAMSGLAGGMGAHLVGSETDASFDVSKVDEGVLRRMATLPGIKAVEGFLTGYTTLGDLPFFIVFGYQPRGLSVREYKIVGGEPLTTNRQIILGRVAAENLKKDVGQTLRLFETSFKIVGIYETGVPMQDGGGVISLRDAQTLFGKPRKVSFFAVWLEDPQEAEEVTQMVETRFPEVTLSQASDFADDLVDIQMMEGYTWAIAAMALLVGGLGMMNTMFMSVFERTREIGVLRALGWARLRILSMIVRESLAVSFLGGVAGCLIGIGAGLLLNMSPALQGWIEMKYSVGLFEQALGTALVLGIVGGVYPAWWASRLQPVEALRYE